MIDLSPYQADHLFLLIGSNPLPNYVAIRLLAHPDSQLYFVYSRETEKIAGNLKQSLGRPKAKMQDILVDDAEAHDIYNQVRRWAAGKERIGLHYTGGTKAMSVHAYRAVLSVNQQATFSYLNARNLNLLIDRAEARSRECPVGLEVTLSLEKLLKLHGYTIEPNKPLIREPFEFELCRALVRAPHKVLREWCDANLRTGGELKGARELNKSPLNLPFDQPALIPAQPYLAGCVTLNDLATKWGRSVHSTAKFLDGEWLEHYTLGAIQQVRDDSYLNDAVLDINPVKKKSDNNATLYGDSDKRRFQFDVAAMRGYQLFAISCTTSMRKSIIKSKLLEAYRRARQMGGDEARVAVVCYSPPDNPDNHPLLIEQDVGDEWEEAKEKVRVFGEQHLGELPAHLKSWFNRS